MVNSSTVLLGPFDQIVTMQGLKTKGPLADDGIVILEESGILCDANNGLILAIGPYRDFDTARAVCYPVKRPAVAFPGMIDAHTHLCWVGERSEEYALRLRGCTYEEIAAAGGGIAATVKATRAASVETLEDTMLMRLGLCQKNGVTTCEIKSGYGLGVAEELTLLRAIGNVSRQQPVRVIATCLAAHCLPSEYSTADEYLSVIANDLLPKVIEERLASRVDIFVDRCAFSIADARTYLLEAKRQGFALCLHADQFSCGGSALAAEVGAISADHLEVSGDQEAALLAAANVIPIVLPGASLGLGIPFAPARRLLDAGLPVVIASDWNPGTAPMGDLLTCGALMGCQQKLTLAETWAGMTCRAAKALGCHDRGILAPGYLADIAIFPCRKWKEVLYWQGAMKPSCTLIGGKVL